MNRITHDVLRASTGLQSFDAANGKVPLLAVAGTADVYTHSQEMQGVEGLVLWYKAKVDSGTPDIDLYLQQSPFPPTTEGAAGDASDGWITVGNKIADVTDELWHYVTLSPVLVGRMRILADGQGTNPASCKIALILGRQELLD